MNTEIFLIFSMVAVAASVVLAVKSGDWESRRDAERRAAAEPDTVEEPEAH